MKVQGLVVHGGAGPEAPRKPPNLSCFKGEAWKYGFCSQVGSLSAMWAGLLLSF